MDQSPFFCENAIEDDTGVSSAYGIAYRFGFFLESQSEGETDSLYYRIMVGNPWNEGCTIEEVSCLIKKSLFTDKDKEVRIYKYASGPIVIFSGDKIVGIIKDGNTGDTLWNEAANYVEIIDEELPKDSRETYLLAGNVEERFLLYTIKIDPKTNQLTKLQRNESFSYPNNNKGYSTYTLSLEEGSLYVKMPSNFRIKDLRTMLQSSDSYEGGDPSEDETWGIKYFDDKLINSGENVSSVLLSGINDVTQPGSTGITYVEEGSEQPLLTTGEFEFLTIDSTTTPVSTIAPFGFCRSDNDKYYPVNVLGSGISDSSAMVLYGALKVSEPDTPNDGTLSGDFEMEINHYIGSLPPTSPSLNTDEVFVPLCAVVKNGDTYRIVSYNETFSECVGGNGLTFKNAVGSPRDSGETVVDGDSVVIGIEVGEDGKIRAITSTLDTDDDGNGDAGDDCNEDNANFPSNIDGADPNYEDYDDSSGGTGGGGEDDELFPSETLPVCDSDDDCETCG